VEFKDTKVNARGILWQLESIKYNPCPVLHEVDWQTDKKWRNNWDRYSPEDEPQVSGVIGPRSRSKPQQATPWQGDKRGKHTGKESLMDVAGYKYSGDSALKLSLGKRKLSCMSLLGFYLLFLCTTNWTGWLFVRPLHQSSSLLQPVITCTVFSYKRALLIYVFYFVCSFRVEQVWNNDKYCSFRQHAYQSILTSCERIQIW